VLTIDRAWNMRLAAHDELAVRYRRLLPDGTPSEMQGEVWAFVISGPGVSVEPAASVRDKDLEGPYFELRHPADVAPALVGKVGLRWALAEVLPGGQLDTRFSGLLTVQRAAPVTITPPAVGEGGIPMIIERESA
jgi:hypothetical protein